MSRLASLTAATLLVASCGSTPKPPRWRVLIYIAADNDLAPAATRNLEELTTIAPDGVSVGVQVDQRPHRFLGRELAGDAQRLWLKPDGRGWQSQPLDEPDSASPETLRGFLQWGADVLPGEDTVLVLWGHGVSDDALLPDESPAGALSLSQLSGALFPVDVVALDVCAMQTLATARAMPPSVSLLVGSQSARHPLGWPLHDLLVELQRRPDASDLEVAGWFVRSTEVRGGAHTTSVVDPSEVAPLDEALTALLSAADALDEPARRALADRLYAITPTSRAADLRDLGAVLDVLAPLDPSAAVLARARYDVAVPERRSSPEYADATGISVSASRLQQAGLTSPEYRRRAVAVSIAPRVSLVPPE
ncbi:MAG: hypothetical protein H6739_27515 [Alphaproteobacteria bacterium]|nr:hypothetical protein [Alphaproteobacteria bacterium]